MKQNKIPRNEYIRKPVGKTNPYKHDVLYTNLGQWKYPGQVTRIPSNDITMQGVPYPVYGEDNLGYSQMMYPGMDYQFPGQYVTEIPMAQEGFENQEDPIAHLKWGKYIDDPNRRKQHIVDVYQYLMDSRWDPKNIVSFMKNVGGYGSKSRGSLAKSGADWGWDNEDITNEVLGEAWDDYYNKVRKIKSKQAYGGDPSLANIEGHYKTGGWLDELDDEYRRGGQRRKKRGTSKNIQSSINDVFRRNYDVFGPAGKNYFNPRYMAEGGSTEEELEILEPGIDPKTGVPIKSKKEQYQDKIKNNYQSYLESVNNITPYTPVTKEGHMNCIHGVCTVIEGTGAKKFTQEYTGNMTFSDARNKEGFYEVDPTKEGFEIGDIIQYSRKKANAATMGRFKPSSTLTPVNKDDLIPQHAKVILDKYVDDDGITRYVVGHNGGEDYFFITPDSDNGDVKEETLLKHFKEGYNTYDGLIINRYDPDVVEKKEGEKKAEIDTIKGKNSYAHMYNNTPKISIKKEIYDTDLNKKVIEDSGPAKKLLEYYKKNYKELGKTADMPPYLLNQLFHNQIGIAEQESKSGEDLGAKQYVPESLTPTFRKLKESISPNDDDWVKDYWAKNVNNVRSTYKSIDNFKNYLNQDKKLSKEAREYLYYNSPKSKGMFQQKELSKRGRILGSNFDTPEKQFLSSMYLAIDNYHLLKNKYPDLSESELVDLTTLMHNSPGKALTKEYVDYYLKNNDIDYVNKVKEKRGILEQPSNKYAEKMQKFNNQKVTTKEIADIKKFLQNIPSKKYGGMLKKYQGDEEGNQVMPDEAIPGVNYFSLPEVTVKPKTMLERIPYAMIKDNRVYYPGIGIVRKKMGGWLDKYNNF